MVVLDLDLPLSLIPILLRKGSTTVSLAPESFLSNLVIKHPPRMKYNPKPNSRMKSSTLSTVLLLLTQPTVINIISKKCEYSTE